MMSVMVHCSDGWDRTSQITGLAQICLDVECRTPQGFLILIQKEWLWFGHQTSTRNGNYGHNGVPTNRDGRSPIFIQWLNCVYQLMRKFPWAFGFTERFLLDIAYHFHSGRFGDFFHNCDQNRKKYGKYYIPLSMFKWFDRELKRKPSPYVN